MSASIISFPVMAKSADLDLPNRIRALREARGLTLQELAPMIGLHFSYLGKIERGKRELTKPVMERLARALEVAEADLLNTEDGGLTERERFIIDTYRQIPAAMRGAIEAVAESQQSFRGAPEVEDLRRDRSA